MKKPIIVAAKRTAFGKYGGTLKHLEPEQLLLPLFENFKSQCPDIMTKIDDIILGNVVGNGGNVARKSLLEASLDSSIPGVTIDRQCGSGLEAVIQACRMIQAEAGKVFIAGGVESSSRAPWKIKRPQSVYDNELPMFYERASFAPENQDPSMIEAAENVAQHYNITKEQQDRFAYESHQKTIKAYDQQQITQEILPITVKGKSFSIDESVKPRLTYEKISRFKPLLADGSVSIGNCCMKNDGAVLLLVMEEKLAQSLGFIEGLQFIDSSIKGVNPNLLGIGPVPAVTQLLHKHKMTMQDIDAVELNEAFASQVLACKRQLDITERQLNQWGGAIASGHPYGASGAALVTRLFYMKKADKSIATMGIGGGMGNAILFHRWN
ncbi:thiolase family protein [Staphylococcus sp. 18_1_E_LY]|uniref:Putative acetyl-CoA C-acetyltransferase VraB n=1 Tax=Staphylococcus lloydii TaxID=2781774 RepID=A0A7T1AZ79_9STAP|nr:thiolase family protein [Staphylococcus lloydii]MBF7019463.1 thiolase family protein [Staphylococcus lloydii]MBF7027190.1 thiolase family protein [Staphylococcus lloydii]QPM74831.1 thiolase family protein [Staphylococcus lloydii]